MITCAKRLVARQEQPACAGRCFQFFDRGGNLSRHKSIDRESIGSEPDCRLEHYCAGKPSIFCVSAQQSTYSSWNTDSSRRGRGAKRAQSGVRYAAGRVVEVEIFGAMAFRIPVQKSTAGSKSAHHRLGDTESECRCDRSIYGIPAAAQHLETCLARVGITCGDYASLGHNPLPDIGTD